MLGGSFLVGVDARKGRWRLAATEAKGISTQRLMRRTLDNHGDGRDRAAAVISLVDELGLQPSLPVEPLPEIDEKDVNLVTWMALVPQDFLGTPKEYHT